jgi:NADP-dependent 3-hydroxy acid dehydrogenase YdfG
MKVKDKVVVITGASSGIGEATARLLSKHRAKVVLAARSKETAIQLLYPTYNLALELTIFFQFDIPSQWKENPFLKQTKQEMLYLS